LDKNNYIDIEDRSEGVKL